MVDLLAQNSIKTELKIANVSFQGSSEASMDQQVQLAPNVQPGKADLTVFFGIGMIVNIVMIVSFFIWAVKQWKKNDKK
ncbi:MAG: hypothetical protein OEY06_03805 [Gammaproteobacteria bacterium]|nr:hypothetical protein [Gammaproteobacteria bacterium]